MKRKLKFFETTVTNSSGECPWEQIERPLFLFIADSNGQLRIYINSWFPITSLSLNKMIQTDEIENKFIVQTKRIKAAKDLSKLYLLTKLDKMHYFLMIDTRFIGYKSSLINDVSKLIYESFEYLKFIENKFEEWTTFWNIAFKKYSFEISQMEKSCNISDKSKPGTSDKTSNIKSDKSIIEDLKMLAVYSMMSKGLQKYFEQIISVNLKELAKREETIQNELDKIENFVTNFIISAIEVVMLKLSTLKGYANKKVKAKEDTDSHGLMQNIVGVDGDLVDGALERLFKLQRNFEALNLLIVEAKLDIKNFYVFISKNASKIAILNNQQEDNDTALNTLNKYIVDMNRLLDFIKSNEDLRLEKWKLLMENSSKVIGGSSEDLNAPNQLESLFIQNFEKVFSKRVSKEDSVSKIIDGNIGVLLKETKDIFNRIYHLPCNSISKFYRPLQQILLGTKDETVIFDMYTESNSLSEENESHNELNEESKITIQESNMCDSNRFTSEVLFAIKYQLGKEKRDFLWIYYQRTEKKVYLEDNISFNIALEELPANYNLCEWTFYGKKSLILLLKPKYEMMDEQSILWTINLENLQYNNDCFDQRINNLESYIEDKISDLQYGQLEFSNLWEKSLLKGSRVGNSQNKINNIKVIDTLSVNGLTSSGSGSYSVLLHNRKLKMFN